MVCNLGEAYVEDHAALGCRNPLTGLSGLQPSDWERAFIRLNRVESQSPCRAKWLATSTVPTSSLFSLWRRNPLAGLNGFQREEVRRAPSLERLEVAIPLRG